MHDLATRFTYSFSLHLSLPPCSRHRGEEQREIGTWKCSDVVLVYSLHEQEYELYNEYQFMYPSNQSPRQLFGNSYGVWPSMFHHVDTLYLCHSDTA